MSEKIVRRKLNTTLDEKLLKKVSDQAFDEKKDKNIIIEEALTEYYKKKPADK
jgi:hypothetical protein